VTEMQTKIYSEDWRPEQSISPIESFDLGIWTALHLLQLEEEEDGRILQHGAKDEDDTGDHPGLDRSEALRLWRVGLDRVVDVDENKEEGDQHRHPARDHLGVDEEADPGDDDKQSRGEVVGNDVEAHLAREDDLEAGGAIVHPNGHVVGVLRLKGLEVDPIVEDGLDDGVLWHNCILKLNFAHRIVEAAHPKLANLNIDREGVEVHLTDKGDLARHCIHHLIIAIHPHSFQL